MFQSKWSIACFQGWRSAGLWKIETRLAFLEIMKDVVDRCWNLMVNGWIKSWEKRPYWSRFSQQSWLITAEHERQKDQGGDLSSY